MTSLFPYQQAGVEFLAGRRAALLADDPRLGKTYQSVGACDRSFALRVLVICPAGVVENWKRKLPELRQGDWWAYVTSYEKAWGADHARIMAQEWDVLIVDEAHYAKDPTSKRTRALYGKNCAAGEDSIVSRAAQVWLLTGTPMLNHPGELFPHLRALAPEKIMTRNGRMPMTYSMFMQAFCEMRHNGFGLKPVGSKREAELNQILEGFMLRRTRAEVLGHLPPTAFEELYVEGDVSGIPGEEIDIVREVLAKDGIEGLRVAAANGSVSTLRRLTGIAKVPGVAQWTKDWLQSRPKDEKIVIFAHHKEVIEGLYDRLHLDFVRVESDVKARGRQKAIDAFQSDPAVRGIIVRMTGDGVGISLARADEMLVLEPSWVPAVNAQVYERIFDLGKTRKNLVRTVVIANSIDEDIQRAIVRKMQSISKVVDGV